MSIRRIIRGAIWGAVLGWVLAPTSGGAAPHRTTVLQGLDKVTARVSTIDAPIGATVRFGTLEIIVRHCDKRPPEETPESAAFLDIWETRPGESAVSLFRGWMYASSPALSAVEHPVYDVWVLDCRDQLAPGEGAEPAPRPRRKFSLPDLGLGTKPR